MLAILKYMLIIHFINYFLTYKKYLGHFYCDLKWHKAYTKALMRAQSSNFKQILLLTLQPPQIMRISEADFLL